MRFPMLVVLAVLGSLTGPTARGQFVDTPVSRDAAPSLGDVRTQKFRVGLAVTAANGACHGLYATAAVPAEWPEQKVRIIAEDVSPAVRRLTYRTLDSGAKQMVVEIPEIPAGTRVQAIVTFEIDRAAIVAPTDTAGLRIPERPAMELRNSLGPGPYIETRNPKVVAFARQAAAGKEGWEKVESIYDAVRDKVAYRNGDLKGAARALADGWGDCEELTCLFIAACRVEGIPARTVWVEGHCYPEFWLEDASGTGRWYPCQAAGTRAFGSMPDQLPILQKGDDFRDPDRPGKSLRYVSEFLRGTPAPGAGPPRIEWFREPA